MASYNSCPNCLARVDEPGLCHGCMATVLCMGSREYDTVLKSPYEPDEVWIRQLKERRMKAYARARKAAGRG